MASQANTKHDAGLRRRSQRTGRERGCWVYVPAEVLEKAGFDPAGERPWFRTWPGRKRTVLVQLYDAP